MHRSPRINWLLVATVSILIIGIALSIAAAFQPLWLDEIWSLSLAESIQRPWEVFAIHHLNNHPINTLYLWLLGYGQPTIVYRIPSLLSGIALLLWMTRDGWRRSRSEGCFVAIFIGFSLPILQTAAEARGYSPMLLAAYAAYVFFERMERTGERRDGMYYAFFASLAILLHLSAVTLVLAAAAATFVRSASKSGVMHGIAAVMWRHGAPVLTFGLLVLGTLRQDAFSAGRDPGITFAQFGSAVLGWGEISPLAAMIATYAVVCVVLVVIECVLRRDAPFGVFLLTILFVVPAILLLLGMRALGLEVRFFLPSVVAFLLLLSSICALGWSHSGIAAKIAVCTVAMLFIAGHSVGIFHLLRYGRLESRSVAPALTCIEEQSSAQPVTVGTEFTIDRVLVEYYGNILSERDAFSIIEHDAWASTPPEWLLERRFAWTDIEQVFRALALPDYTIVNPAGEGQLWTIWSRKKEK